MKKDIFIVGTYSVLHFIIDMMCAIVMMALVSPLVSGSSSYVIVFILYNMFAFAFQLPFGIIADKLNKNAIVSSLGCVFVAMAFVFTKLPLLMCILAGIGNALFHVGGGVDVLNIANRKASKPGIYVSTGAIGLFLGLKFASFFITYKWILVLILLISSVFLVYAYNKINKEYEVNNEEVKIEKIHGHVFVILLCIFITIVMRSYLGFILNYEWKSNLVLSILFVCGVVLGKMLGGILGDKFGLKRVATISLVLSAICLGFAFKSPILGILGILLFNMTMPITLIIASNTLYSSKGFAFGLTTLALFIGAIPSLLKISILPFNTTSVIIGVIVSSVIFYIGAHFYDKKLEKEKC